MSDVGDTEASHRDGALPAGNLQHEHVILVRGEAETRKLVRRLMHSGDKQPPQSQGGFLIVTPNIDVHFL